MFDKTADDQTRTQALCCQKQPLCQLSNQVYCNWFQGLGAKTFRQLEILDYDP